MTFKTMIALGGVVVFLIGSGSIIYYNRPVMDLPLPSDTPVATEEIATESPTPSPVANELPSQNPEPNAQVPVPAQPAEQIAPVQTAPTPVTPPATPDPNSFSLADVAKHNSVSDCWSAIRGNVYNLTSWIERHPGGPQPIIGLCGKDGTALYEGAHGNAKRPASMLILLKIGSLK